MELKRRDIAKALGKPLRTIQFWGDNIPINADIQPKSGKGIAQLYSKRNLIEFSMVDVMTGDGIPLEIIRPIISILKSGMFRDIQETLIEFSDFYENPVWGRDRDLVFLTDRLHYKVSRPIVVSFAVVSMGRNWPEDVGKAFSVSGLSDSHWRSIVLLKLGIIKKQASRKVGLE